jgi:hypothetical protein
MKYGWNLGIFEGHGSFPFFSDLEPLKYKYRIGLETLVSLYRESMGIVCLETNLGVQANA